jgi:ATP synthase protein I
VTESSGNDGGDDLDRRIAEAQAKHGRGVTDAEGQAETRGWAIGIEFVGAVLVSGFIGWAIDHWLAPRFAPWGMILFLVLGFAAGVRRAMKTSAEFDTDTTNASHD